MQIIAMITMLLDHIGVVWFPNDSTWRVIGRLALPLYAYALMLGYMRTQNVNRYIWRMLGIAALSQIPYSLAFGTYEVNTVGTLFVCLLLLRLLDKYASSLAIQIGIALLVIVAVELIPFSYGAYLPILVLIYRYASPRWMVSLHLLLNIFFLFYQGWAIQLFSLFATLIIIYLPKFLRVADRITVPRIIWRSFYPLHLAIIALIHYLLFT